LLRRHDSESLWVSAAAPVPRKVSIPGAFLPKAWDYLRNARGRLKGAGARVRMVAHAALTADGILDGVRRKRAPLIAIAMHGNGDRSAQVALEGEPEGEASQAGAQGASSRRSAHAVALWAHVPGCRSAGPRTP